MRVRTLEIRWHDNKPINSCDFQPAPFKKARPGHDKDFTAQSYRLATGGEDNNVRVWMMHPNILPPSVAKSASTSASATPAPHPPRVEYLATLNRHTAPVNVVRFSPDGELIASAGDDGMIIVWAPSNSQQSGGTFGSDADDLQYEKEYWKARTIFKCGMMQVYDLAWSPTGEYIIAGSTDNTARIFDATDGKCLREIAEHTHYVQGVAWDPLNEFVATQSSDRSVHVYSVSTKPGSFEVHAVGKNTRMSVRHSRTPSVGTRPRAMRRESVASDAESAITSTSEHEKEAAGHGGMLRHPSAGPLTPAPSIASTPSQSIFLPPPTERTMSRRSSFSSAAPGSPPPQFGHMGRSPSPMPPLPAIRAPPSPQQFAQTRLYGDESFTNFFRRLTFSPDGGLLLTPSGHFEDPSNIGIPAWTEHDSTPTRGRRGNPADSNPASASSVYIYSRANFARPPIAHLPGHKKPSVAVKFSPILYELRQGVVGARASETKNVAVERGNNDVIDVDLTNPVPKIAEEQKSSATPTRTANPSPISTTSASIARMASPRPAQTLPSPALSAIDMPQTPVYSAPSQTGSLFDIPYRMLFAVATMDAVSIHDTQQAGPVCLLTKLHYDEFTDMTWSPDGQCLMLSSRDGYCTIVIFDELLPTHHTQQQGLQLQSIAQHHSHSHSHSHSHAQTLATPSYHGSTHPSASPAVTPSPTPAKRSVPLPTPSELSLDGQSNGEVDAAEAQTSEPPKKKRRVALTQVSG